MYGEHLERWQRSRVFTDIVLALPRLMGAPFLHSYYLIFHYQANLMGFATKNVAASAATSAVLIGEA